MKKVLPILLLLSLLLALTACSKQESSPQIPTLNYEASSRSYRIAEQYNPTLLTVSDVMDYESPYAIYHFDAAMESAERDTCVYYTDLILSYLKMGQKPELLIIDDYEGAWAGNTLYYIGDGDFASADFGAKLITLFCGEYTNYGAAYGFAAYILGQEPGKLPALTESPARDLNWLCFREEFVPAEEISVNRIAACAFAVDYITANGEQDYVQLLKQSADPETVAAFNTVLSNWYARQGLEYVPSEVLYGIGGEHHDYLVKHTYATMYMAKTWNNSSWWSTLIQDDRFLHESYEDIKYCFELTKLQMATLQEALGFDIAYEPITVEFLSQHGTSKAYPNYAKLDIGDIGALCHEYTHYLTTRMMRHNYYQYRWLDEDLTDYLAITSPNPYEFAKYDYAKDNGLPVQASITGDWNEIYKSIIADMEDPLDMWRARWDLYAYYYEDYDINGIAIMSFPAYVIDTLGYDTLYHYGYVTDQEPPELDLTQLRSDWVAYLQETYGQYPQYKDYHAQESNIEENQ